MASPLSAKAGPVRRDTRCEAQNTRHFVGEGYERSRYFEARAGDCHGCSPESSIKSEIAVQIGNNGWRVKGCRNVGSCVVVIGLRCGATRASADVVYACVNNDNRPHFISVGTTIQPPSSVYWLKINWNATPVVRPPTLGYPARGQRHRVKYFVASLK